MPCSWQTHSQSQDIIPVMAEISPRQRQYVDAKTSLRAILASNPSMSPTASCTQSPTTSPTITSSPTIASTTPLSVPQSTNQSQKALANLISQTNTLGKQSAQAEELVRKTTEELKEFGDLQTWAEVVWREIYVLEEVLTSGDERDGTGRG